MNLQARFDSQAIANFNIIKSLYPDAIVAGGAVRDLVMGKPIKDIDIFVGGTPNTSITAGRLHKRNHWIHNPTVFWRGQLNDSKWIVTEKGQQSSCHHDPKIDTVISLFNPSYTWHTNPNYYANVKSIPSIDIIFLLKPSMEYFREDFDFNICKAMFDGKQIGLTNYFLDDVQNKTITLSGVKDPSAVWYSLINHLPRIQAKYQGFTPTIPPDYKPFVPASVGKI